MLFCMLIYSSYIYFFSIYTSNCTVLYSSFFSENKNVHVHVNKHNDYEKTCSVCFVKVFKFQEKKFKIVQRNFLEKPLVTMIIT